MKQILVKMAPDVFAVLQSAIEDAYPMGTPRPDGTGCAFHQWMVEPELAEYWISLESAVIASVMNMLLAQGLSITFPEPKMIPQLDGQGNPVLDATGQPVMVEEALF